MDRRLLTLCLYKANLSPANLGNISTQPAVLHIPSKQNMYSDQLLIGPPFPENTDDLKP